MPAHKLSCCGGPEMGLMGQLDGFVMRGLV